MAARISIPYVGFPSVVVLPPGCDLVQGLSSNPGSLHRAPSRPAPFAVVAKLHLLQGCREPFRSWGFG